MNAQDYETFERMHWVCFHLAYEHVNAGYDPDERCNTGGCFWPEPSRPLWRKLPWRRKPTYERWLREQ